MHVDWQLVEKTRGGEHVALEFQRVCWVRGDHANIACEFDDPDATPQQMLGRMTILETVERAEPFELGKCYRASFG